MATIKQLTDPAEEPDMLGYDVTMDYTDSAILQMRMTTPLVKQYTSAKEPRDSFPLGLHVVMFERDGSVKADIRADWAVNSKAVNLWEARGNVVAYNAAGDTLKTEQMFWNTAEGKIYSSHPTRISSPSIKEAIGENGFVSNQDFSKWRLINSRATINVKDSVAATPVSSDSASIVPTVPTPAK